MNELAPFGPLRVSQNRGRFQALQQKKAASFSRQSNPHCAYNIYWQCIADAKVLNIFLDILCSMVANLKRWTVWFVICSFCYRCSFNTEILISFRFMRNWEFRNFCSWELRLYHFPLTLIFWNTPGIQGDYRVIRCAHVNLVVKMWRRWFKKYIWFNEKIWKNFIKKKKEKQNTGIII